MRLSLAPVAAVLVLCTGPARAVEPLDLDLTRLGAPSAAIWTSQAGVADPVLAGQLAADSRVRFGRLASDLALAFSSALLQPASTSGHSGFIFDMEGAYVGVSHGVVGQAQDGAAYPRDSWPTHSLKPFELFVPSIHVRKAFPFSVELGGRLMYLSQSSYYAAQVEGKWALVEGFWVLPDVALRGAHTEVLGQRDLRLSTTEFDVLVSKRFGVNAVSSLTPYLAARFTLMNASTRLLAFAPDEPAPRDPGVIATTSAAFPTLNTLFYRTTFGVRLTAYAVALAAEATWYAGGKQGQSNAADDQYPRFWVPGSWGGAFKFGFEF